MVSVLFVDGSKKSEGPANRRAFFVQLRHVEAPMQRLVVIAGPERSGKMPLARRLMSGDNSLMCVHRDDIRAALVNPLDEGHITLCMGALAGMLLSLGSSVIVVAWNLEPADRDLWTRIAADHGAPMAWMDVRDADVAAMIPPMAEAS